MSVLRQQNWLGQQRIDVPHLRALESSIAADFDLMAGKIIAGGKTLVVSGFEIQNPVAGGPATSLQLAVANSIIMHPSASEAGTIFSVTGLQPVETLSSTNPNVDGNFTPNQTNYVGLDLTRQADDSTTDLVMFLNADTLQETPRSVPLARTLFYKIVISTVPFESTPDILPIAKVVTNSLNTVTSISDCRHMAFRLGTGGSNPNKQAAHVWTAGRNEKVQDTANDLFNGGDKTLASFREWMEAVMSRLWEVGGGEFWYSATTDRDLKVAFGQPVLGSNQDNWDWNGTTLSWSGISVLFGASTGWYNLVQAGNITLADGECLYVDVDRATNAATIVPAKAVLTALTQPAIPTARLVLAWRRGTLVYTRDRNYEVNRALVPASTTVLGGVQLSGTPGSSSNPRAATIDGNGLSITKGLTRDGIWDASAGTLSIGTGTNDSSVTISKAGANTAVIGTMTVAQGITSPSVNAVGTLNIGTTAGTTTITIGHAPSPAQAMNVNAGTTNFNGNVNVVGSDTVLGGQLEVDSASSFFGDVIVNANLEVTGISDLAVIDRTGTISIGSTSGTTINVSRTGQTTAVAGALTVAQGVTVPTTQEYSYSAARTYTKQVSAMAFYPVSNAAVSPTFFSGDPGFYARTTDTVTLHVQIDLPIGAVITGVWALCQNTNANTDSLGYNFVLHSYNGTTQVNDLTDITAGGPGTAFLSLPNGSAKQFRALSLSAGTHAMPTDGHLAAYIVLPMVASGTNFAFFGLKVTYTITQIAP